MSLRPPCLSELSFQLINHGSKRGLHFELFNTNSNITQAAVVVSEADHTREGGREEALQNFPGQLKEAKRKSAVILTGDFFSGGQIPLEGFSPVGIQVMAFSLDSFFRKRSILVFSLCLTHTRVCCRGESAGKTSNPCGLEFSSDLS